MPFNSKPRIQIHVHPQGNKLIFDDADSTLFSFSAQGKDLLQKPYAVQRIDTGEPLAIEPWYLAPSGNGGPLEQGLTKLGVRIFRLHFDGRTYSASLERKQLKELPDAEEARAADDVLSSKNIAMEDMRTRAAVLKPPPREKKDEQAMALDLHSTILARSPIRLTFRLGEKQLVPLEVAISLGDKRSELGEHSGPC